MAYSIIDGSIHIRSFYRRVLDLIDFNDFGHKKSKLLNEEPSYIARALVELCRGKAHKIETGEIFENEKESSPIQISLEFSQ